MTRLLITAVFTAIIMSGTLNLSIADEEDYNYCVAVCESKKTRNMTNRDEAIHDRECEAMCRRYKNDD